MIYIKRQVILLENPAQKPKLIGEGRSNKYKEYLGGIVKRHETILKHPILRASRITSGMWNFDYAHSRETFYHTFTKGMVLALIPS